MAQEVLVGQILTKEMIDAGAELLRDIEGWPLELSAAFWLFFSEADEWRLVLVSSRVDTDGPLKLYAKLSDLLYNGTEKKYGLDLSNISLFSPGEPLVRAAASVSKLYDLTGKRLARGNFNGVYVEDIYVYFVNESVQPISDSKFFFST